MKLNKTIIVTLFLLATVLLYMGAAGNITKNTDTAVTLEATSLYSGDTSVLAEDQTYDWNDVGIDVTGAFGIHVVLDYNSVDSNEADDFIFGMQTSIDGTNWDTIPAYEITIPASDYTTTQKQSFGFDVTNFSWVNFGVKSGGTDDTFDYKIAYRLMTYNYSE